MTSGFHDETSYFTKILILFLIVSLLRRTFYKQIKKNTTQRTTETNHLPLGD